MTTTWYYPSIDVKKAPKAIRCSGCSLEIAKGKRYYRHNHGRYCKKCSGEFEPSKGGEE